MEQFERIPFLVRTSMSALETLSLALGEKSSFSSESATSRSHVSKFKLWSGCLGAHRVAGTRSLSYRLRDASSIRKTVFFLLENLERYVREAQTIAQQDPVEHDEEETEDSTDEELTAYFRDNDSDGSSDNADLQRILSQIEEVLDCLMRLAITIRNPAPYDQFRSRAGVISHSYQWDIEHVQHKFPNIDPVISDRLGKALTQRRRYLNYREEHHLRLQEGLNSDDDDNGSRGKGTTIASSLPHISRDNAPTPLEDTEDTYSEISTISYATTSADQGGPRIPPIPLDYESGPFLCPFCHMLISVDAESDWKARLEWKKHVYRDLRPYVCLEEQCTTANQDFQKRKDWTRHMLQEHWRIWTCPFDCKLGFQTSNDSINHTLEKHKAQISSERVEDLMSLSSNADLKCAEGKCPLCLTFDIKNSRMYESHVGKHLEQLALFVLPQISGDESEQDDGTEDDQDDEWETNPEEEQISDMGSEASGEELPEPELETEGDFRYEELSSAYGHISESESEDRRPQIAEPVPRNQNMHQDPAIRAMLAQLDSEQRQKFRQLPPDKLDELFSKWERTGLLHPGQSVSAAMSDAFEDNRTRNKDSSQGGPVEDRPHHPYEHEDEAHRTTGGHEGKSPGGRNERQAPSSDSQRKCGVVGCDRKHIYELVANEEIWSSYCQEHTCQAPRNDRDPFCINPRDPVKRYCSFHGKCRGAPHRDCVAQATWAEKEPYPYICPLHRCTIKDCQSRRVGTSFCERHAAHVADYGRRSEMPEFYETDEKKLERLTGKPLKYQAMESKAGDVDEVVARHKRADLRFKQDLERERWAREKQEMGD